MTVSLDRVLEIGRAMLAADLPEDFVRRVTLEALDDLEDGILGMAGLMELWAEDGPEADECIADMQEHLDDVDAGGAELPYIRFDDLERIASNIVQFKAALRRHVDAHGGVGAVARAAGIPQPSLSRLLNSASMPQRRTLDRLARAMGLSEVEVATEWAR
jgi:DNA-binding phage protein